MRIAFDIDGVLTDLNLFLKEYGTLFFRNNEKKYGRLLEIINSDASSIKEMFNCTDIQEKEFWQKYLFFYSSKIKARIGAAGFIKKLIDDGNDLYILTARIKAFDDDVIGDLIKKIVFKWLRESKILIKKENIQFCPITNSAEFKANWCKKNNIDYMIEDSPANISEISKICKVICFDNPYNRDFYWDGVVKVKTFREIYNLVSSNYKNDILRELNREERQKLSILELDEYYEKLRYKYKMIGPTSETKLTEKKYNILYPIFDRLVKSKYKYEIENEELLDEIKPGTLFVLNHRDLIDIPIAISALGKRPTHFLLKSEYAESKAENFLTSVGCLYVDRNSSDSQALSKEEMIKLLLTGHNVIICPEGTRNKTTSNLLPFKMGAAYIAQTAGSDIRPIVIRKKFDDFNEKIVVTIGENFTIGIHDDLTMKNNELHDIMEKMYVGSDYKNDSTKVF